MSQSNVALPPAIFIMGPTASGKTDLAVSLASKYLCELISVDSALIYKDMDIGTAKPDKKTLEKAPHKLISFLDPSESYSAADFRRDALTEMQAATEAGKIPVLVGGTMLYFRALEYGLADMPDANPEVRKKLLQEATEHGWQYLHDRLADLDPESAKRIHPNDPQRLQRALEVYELTGCTMTELHRQASTDALPYCLLKIALIPSDREWLRERAALRFELMLKAGFIEEVNALYQRGDLDENLPSIRCVGYRQAWEYLEGRVDFGEMKFRAITATRQLAKRQLTWLRSEQRTQQYDPLKQDTSSIITDIGAFLSDKQDW
ncbi:MAG: tRNA (adenosine(37)-N6)-dimethylallyltransferase MiaA [Proteobacteria bacterium]|nr:MAG: tRNA (adenosine(37)-N6)-dimethylallyltransferase MiaA [Pseudomonadota bacterium]